MRAFVPRPITFCGVRHEGAWRLKRYAITRDAADGDRCAPWDDFAPGRALALASLPEPALAEGRAGVGFVIEHRGAGADYLVLGWWDRENELPVRVAVREQREGAAWRAAGPSESFCVWDLQVIGFERDAYVATVLGHDAGPDAVETYLRTGMTVPSQRPSTEQVAVGA